MKRLTAFTSVAGIIFFTLISAFAFPVCAQDNPYRAKTFALNKAGNLLVETAGGNITVKGTDSGQVKVEMYVRKKGKNLTQDDTDLKGFDIDISQSGSQIKAIAKKEGKWWKFWSSNNISISFVIYTPLKM